MDGLLSSLASSAVLALAFLVGASGAFAGYALFVLTPDEREETRIHVRVSRAVFLGGIAAASCAMIVGLAAGILLGAAGALALITLERREHGYRGHLIDSAAYLFVASGLGIGGRGALAPTAVSLLFLFGLVSGPSMTPTNMPRHKEGDRNGKDRPHLFVLLPAIKARLPALVLSLLLIAGLRMLPPLVLPLL